MDRNALRTAITHDALRSRSGLDSGFLHRDDIVRRHVGRGMTFSEVSDVVDQALGGPLADSRPKMHSLAGRIAQTQELGSPDPGLAILLPVEKATLAGEPVPTVNARRLHAWLGVGRDYSTWIKERVTSYCFVDGEDFLTEARSPIRGSGNRGASIEYHLTLDMAKELAMVENNARGREARRYFIRCERAARTAIAPAGSAPSMVAFGGMMKGIVNKAVVPVVARQDWAIERQDAMLARMEAMEARLAALTAPAAQSLSEPDGSFLSARGAVRLAGGIGNMRRLVQVASTGLRRFCRRDNGGAARWDAAGRWTFEIRAVRAWMDAGGRERLLAAGQ